MAKEKSLWKWIQKGNLPGQWRRVDARGFPDSACNYKERETRRTFLVELKEMDGWPGDGILQLDMEPGQVAFFKEWKGECYIYAQIGSARYWFVGQDAAANDFRVTIRDAVSGPFKPSD